jgi:hypothetical protein
MIDTQQDTLTRLFQKVMDNTFDVDDPLVVSYVLDFVRHPASLNGALPGDRALTGYFRGKGWMFRSRVQRGLVDLYNGLAAERSAVGWHDGKWTYETHEKYVKRTKKLKAKATETRMVKAIREEFRAAGLEESDYQYLGGSKGWALNLKSVAVE